MKILKVRIDKEVQSKAEADSVAAWLKGKIGEDETVQASFTFVDKVSIEIS